MSQTGESRDHIKCPQCGKRLHLPEIKQAQRLRCPACKHVFSVSPPSQPEPLPGEYTGEGTGSFTKAALATLAALGIALIAVLLYRSAVGPSTRQPPPKPDAIAVKETGATSTSPKPQPKPSLKPASTDKLDPVEEKHAAARRASTRKKETPTKGGSWEAALRNTAPRATKPKPPTEKPKPLSPEQLFEQASPAVVYIVVRDKNFKPIAQGSGFFIDPAGLIVTNYHVIEGADFATAILSNKTTLFVSGVTATDPDADLALLKVSGESFPWLKSAGNALPKIGSTVYAIGNPKGMKNTFSNGMVSGHRQVKEDLTVIQTTAAISPGSSGGPLLNAKGEVVGVTTAYLTGGQNLNFAVPIAKVRELLGKQGKVRTLASAGGKLLDKTATAELLKAWAAMAKKDWPTASRILTALRKTQEDNPFVWYALGYLHGQLRNHEIAIQHYRAAIALKPDYAGAYYNMGLVYARDLKQYTKGIAAFKKAIALKPDEADAYVNMGNAYGDLGQHTEAIAAYKKAIAIKPDYAEAYYNMGIAYRELKRYTDAIAAYKKAIAIKPDDPRAYNNMGVAYHYFGKYAEAVAAYKKAIAIKPDFANAYYNMGLVYEKLAYASDGRQRIIRMQRRQKSGLPISKDYLANYLATFQASEEVVAAIAAYRQYLRLEPKGLVAPKARWAIRKLREH